MQEQICPMLTLANATIAVRHLVESDGEITVRCGSNCAWYDGKHNHCVLKNLVALPEINESIKKVKK